MEKLQPEGLIQPHFMTNPFDHCLRGIIANRSQNRVRRHYATDKESHYRQTKQSKTNADAGTQKSFESLAHALTTFS
jgi:hypothetical protein